MIVRGGTIWSVVERTIGRIKGWAIFSSKHHLTSEQRVKWLILISIGLLNWDFEKGYLEKIWGMFIFLWSIVHIFLIISNSLWQAHFHFLFQEDIPQWSFFFSEEFSLLVYFHSFSSLYLPFLFFMFWIWFLAARWKTIKRIKVSRKRLASPLGP